MEKETIDRLSNLPDHLIHHIYSFFEQGEMSKMISMSKRLRKLCLSSSTLAFGAYLNHPSSSALDFREFVEDLLSSAHQGTPFVSLILTWQRGKQGRTLNCHKALPCLSLPSFQTLVLRYFEVELLETSKLGGWIKTSCPCLKKLVLHFEHCSYNNNHAVVLDSSSLQEIEVIGAKNSKFDGVFRLKITCPSLEHLTIKNFEFEDAYCEIIIVGEQLQTLYVNRAKFLCCSAPLLDHSFRIHAPKLRVFRWKGSPMMQFSSSKESFLSLEKAVLDVWGTHGLCYSKFLKKLLLSMQHAIQFKVILTEILCHPRYVLP